MAPSTAGQNGELPIRKQSKVDQPSYGKEVAKLFLFDEDYRNLNHGSFGCIPRAIQERQRHYQNRVEGNPDVFIWYEYPGLLDESRIALSKLLRAPVECVVFAQNATAGVNTVLRGLEWDNDAKDEILYFDTIYGACGKTISYLVDTQRGFVSSRVISLPYPLEDDEILVAFKDAVTKSKAEGKRPKICVFDAVSSMPGIRFPFEALTKACKELGVLSLVDGAQGIGMIDLNLSELDPDFFISNCHKWLHVPRACAFLYIPLRNQPLVLSTMPTSHGYVAKTGGSANPLPQSKGNSAWVSKFSFIGTADNSPILCVKDSIKWREEVLGGEEKIRKYTWDLALKGGLRIAEILGTEILQNKAGTLTGCSMINVALPLRYGDVDKDVKEASGQPPKAVISEGKENKAVSWMLETLAKDYRAYMRVFTYYGRIWVRISAQVYLDMEDFEWAGRTLLELTERVVKGEYEK